MHMMMDVMCLKRQCRDCDHLDPAIDRDIYYDGDKRVVENQIYCKNLEICEKFPQYPDFQRALEGAVKLIYDSGNEEEKTH